MHNHGHTQVKLKYRVRNLCTTKINKFIIFLCIVFMFCSVILSLHWKDVKGFMEYKIREVKKKKTRERKLTF